MPIDQLASKFDLIVIDHPWAGFAFEKNLVRNLAPIVPPAVRRDLEENAVGGTFASYCYGERLLALPIDAAAPAPSWRADLLERAGIPPPATWSEAVALGRRKLAVIPGFNADLFLHFLMLVKALGTDPCMDPAHIAPREVLRQAVEMLRELTEPMPRAIFDWNPIQVAERMCSSDDFAWNAFAYTYNNYAREGFGSRRLRFGNVLSIDKSGPRLRSVLGGTGIAISQVCRHLEVALDFACFISSGTVQRGLYFQAGGQPAHRIAWDDAGADAICGGFFSGTRLTQEEAFIRPRYSGYVPLQTSGGHALQEALRHGGDAEGVLEKLDSLYRESRQAGSPSFQIN